MDSFLERQRKYQQEHPNCIRCGRLKEPCQVDYCMACGAENKARMRKILKLDD